MKFVQNIKVNSKVYIHNYPRTVKKFLDAWYVLRVAGYVLRVTSCGLRVTSCGLWVAGVGKEQGAGIRFRGSVRHKDRRIKSQGSDVRGLDSGISATRHRRTSPLRSNRGEFLSLNIIAFFIHTNF